MSVRLWWVCAFMAAAAVSASCGNLATSEELGFLDSDTDTDTGCTSDLDGAFQT
jgi:hypothetical protein